MTIESDLRAAFNRHMDNACRLYPAFTANRHRVVFEIVPNMGGIAGQARGCLHIKVNLTLARQNPDYICNNTIPHEIAHIICAHFGWDRGHGKNWKRVAVSLGCTGERCFNAAETGMTPVKLRQRNRYEYVASCGTVVWLSDVMHNKVTNGQQRILASTKGRISKHHFTGKSKVA
jgi:predicted SprT family Zn-dependent metalloprotease